MPRYHFNIRDGVTELDTEGTQLADFKQAKLEGIKLAAAILTEQSEKQTLGQDWRLEITDGQGVILYRIAIALTDTAAMSQTVVAP